MSKQLYVVQLALINHNPLRLLGVRGIWDQYNADSTHSRGREPTPGKVYCFLLKDGLVKAGSVEKA